MEKQREVPLSCFSHAQEQLPQIPPAFDAAMRFAGQVQRQHVGDSDADLPTFEILQGSQGNGSQALWILLAETANAKAENGLVRSLQGPEALPKRTSRPRGASTSILKPNTSPPIDSRITSAPRPPVISRTWSAKSLSHELRNEVGKGSDGVKN